MADDGGVYQDLAPGLVCRLRVRCQVLSHQPGLSCFLRPFSVPPVCSYVQRAALQFSCLRQLVKAPSSFALCAPPHTLNPKPLAKPKP